MPSTTLGFRYPASSDAPNVPQYIQNLADDVDFNFGNRQWVTAYDGPGSYDYALPTSTFGTATSLNVNLTVVQYRQLDVEVSLPSLEASAGGLIAVRLLINNVEVDAATQSAAGAFTGSAKLTGFHPPTGASATVNVRVEGYKVGTGTFKIGGSSGSGPRIRYKMA